MANDFYIIGLFLQTPMFSGIAMPFKTQSGAVLLHDTLRANDGYVICAKSSNGTVILHVPWGHYLLFSEDLVKPEKAV